MIYIILYMLPAAAMRKPGFGFEPIVHGSPLSWECQEWYQKQRILECVGAEKMFKNSPTAESLCKHHTVDELRKAEKEEENILSWGGESPWRKQAYERLTVLEGAIKCRKKEESNSKKSADDSKKDV